MIKTILNISLLENLRNKLQVWQVKLYQIAAQNAANKAQKDLSNNNNDNS